MDWFCNRCKIEANCVSEYNQVPGEWNNFGGCFGGLQIWGGGGGMGMNNGHLRKFDRLWINKYV